MATTKLFHEIYWYCAFRERTNGFLNCEDKTPFKIVKCQKKHWAADPFLFSKDGKTIYIFVELTNTKKGKSVIGVKQLYPNEDSTFTCAIEFDGHSSYPCIFEFNNKIYLIPETGYNKTIQIFECTSFPFKWKKIKNIDNGGYFVDTTPFVKANRLYIFIFEMFSNSKNKKLYLGNLQEDSFNLINKHLICEYKDSTGRPGGNVLKSDNTLYRIVQPSNKYYGERLEMWKFTFDDECYSEELARTIHVKDLKIHDKRHFFGVHTYNYFNNIEVIDLLYYKFSLFKPIKHLLKRIGLFGYGLCDKTGEMIYDTFKK